MGVITFFSAIVRSHTVLLIIGLMIGYLASSAISLLNFFSTAEGVKSYMVWGMGSFGNVSMGEVRWFIPIAILGLLALLFCSSSRSMPCSWADRVCRSGISHPQSPHCPAGRYGSSHVGGNSLLRSHCLHRSCHSPHSSSCHRHGEPPPPAASHDAHGFRASLALQSALHAAF